MQLLQLVWRSGNGVRHINKVKLRLARLVLRLVTDLLRVYNPGIYPGHPGPLSLAITPSVGRCNEYRRWRWPSLGRNGASEVATLWFFKNQFINLKMNIWPVLARY